MEALGEQVGRPSMRRWVGGEAKIESARETTLQDGVTEAMEFIVEWSVQAIPAKSLALYTPRARRRCRFQ